MLHRGELETSPISHYSRERTGMFKAIKIKFNFWADRIIERCDLLLVDAYSLSNHFLLIKPIAQWVGDICLLLKDFPRISAYRLTGNEWNIIYVGSEQNLKEMSHLLFLDCYEQINQPRVCIWDLKRKTDQWLNQGIDLVILELSRAFPFSRNFPTIFSVPTWIQQVLPLPQSIDMIVCGNHALRNKLNRAYREHFKAHFSCDKSDFDHFYYQMYLPFISKRHKDRALIASYEDQYKRWFKRGGLMIITHHDQPICGCLCYIGRDTCYSVEEGMSVEEQNPTYHGLNTFMFWEVLKWGRSQGAKVFDFGGTRPWVSDGCYIYKSRWGAKVVRKKRIIPVWWFAAKNLPASLREHINRIGFLGEEHNNFYRIEIVDEGIPGQLKTQPVD